MTKLAGKNHEYELLDEATERLDQALKAKPSDTQAWVMQFQLDFRALLGDAGWMRTGITVPSSRSNTPTLASALAEVKATLGM